MKFQIRDVLLLTVVASLLAMVSMQLRTLEAKKAELLELTAQQLERKEKLANIKRTLERTLSSRKYFEELGVATRDALGGFDTVVDRYSVVPEVPGKVSFRCPPSIDVDPDASTTSWKIVIPEDATPVFLRWGATSEDIRYDQQKNLDGVQWDDSLALMFQGKYEVKLVGGKHDVEVTYLRGEAAPAVELKINGQSIFINTFLGPGEISGSQRPSAGSPITRDLKQRTQYLITIDLNLSPSTESKGWLWLSSNSDATGFAPFPTPSSAGANQ